MTTRQTAEERREQVLDAATHEFAKHGYHAASTAAIANRAGISQPYIYALFANKRELFLGAHAPMIGRLRSTFIEAAAGLETPRSGCARWALAYRPLIEANRDELLLQMQGHAAAGDPEVGPAVAGSFKALFEDVQRVSGASPEEVPEFFACGMLINVTTALNLPELAAPALEWAVRRRWTPFFLPCQLINQSITRGDARSSRPRPRTGWTLALVSAALFMVTLDNLVVTTALPRIRVDLRLARAASSGSSTPTR